MQQPAEQPWTHIPSKTNKRNRNAPTLLKPSNPPSRDLTLSKLSTEFTSKLQTWQKSTCRKTALQILTRIQPDEGWQLRKAICLGSGSLSRDNLECRRRSVWQMVVFYDLARWLLRAEEELAIHAQEPCFTDLDRGFLSSLGIEALDVEQGAGSAGLGAARQHFGEGTFVFEPFVDMNALMLREMLEAEVGLYIGSSIGGILERRGVSELGKLATTFSEGKEMLKFPLFEVDPNVMNGIGIYWKQEGDEEEG